MSCGMNWKKKNLHIRTLLVREANGVDANLLINQSISYDVVETTTDENIPSYMRNVSSSSRKNSFLLMGGIYDDGF